jgi:hypothetical protein
MDFQFDATADGRRLKLLNVIDKHSRLCLAIRLGRRCKAKDAAVRAGLTTWCAKRDGRQRWPEQLSRNVTNSPGLPPLSPQEGWLSDGRQVLHFQPRRYDRWSQALEATKHSHAVPIGSQKQCV